MQIKEMEAQINLLNDRQIDPQLIEEIKDTERLLKKQIFDESINNEKLNSNINSTKIGVLRTDNGEANICNMSNDTKNNIDCRRENNMSDNAIKGSNNGENHFSDYYNNSMDRAFHEINSDNSFLLFDPLSKKKILHHNNNNYNNNANNNNNDSNSSNYNSSNNNNNSKNDIDNIYINRNNKDVRSYNGMQYGNTTTPLLPNDLLAQRRFRQDSPSVAENPRLVDFHDNNNNNNSNNNNNNNNNSNNNSDTYSNNNSHNNNNYSNCNSNNNNNNKDNNYYDSDRRNRNDDIIDKSNSNTNTNNSIDTSIQQRYNDKNYNKYAINDDKSKDIEDKNEIGRAHV